MKFKFFIALMGLCILSNLNIVSGMHGQDQLPEFAYDFNNLHKPKDMTQLRALEAERNKADYLDDIAAFKSFSLEISATIAGKYGLSSTPETEQAELIYSITRTRHKFSGAKDILPRFYGVDDVKNLPTHHQAHLAAVLTIDTLAAEAMGNDDLLNQWSEIKADQPINSNFIDNVKAHAKTWTKEPLVNTLEPAIDSFLQNSKTIALAHDVFSIFAPKITLKTIYSDMFNGEYRGWTVHGEDSFAYLVTPINKEKAHDLQIGNKFNEYLATTGTSDNIFCSSVVAIFSSSEQQNKLSLNKKTLILEYIYTTCGDIVFPDLFEKKSFALSLTRKINPRLTIILSKSHSSTPKENLLNIYRLKTLHTIDKANAEEINYLKKLGDPVAMIFHAFLIFKGKNDLEKNPLKALQLCRDAIDLGYKQEENVIPEKRVMPFALIECANALYKGENIKKDLEATIALYEEAINDWDDWYAKQNLPKALIKYSVELYNNTCDIKKEKAIEFLRRAVALGNLDAKITITSATTYYAFDLFYGKNGIKKNMEKAIKFCREAKDLGSLEAKNELSVFLLGYAIDLYSGQSGVINKTKAIEFLREAADLGSMHASVILKATEYGHIQNQ